MEGGHKPRTASLSNLCSFHCTMRHFISYILVIIKTYVNGALSNQISKVIRAAKVIKYLSTHLSSSKISHGLKSDHWASATPSVGPYPKSANMENANDTMGLTSTPVRLAANSCSSGTLRREVGRTPQSSQFSRQGLSPKYLLPYLQT